MNLCCDINDINDINNLEIDMNLCCDINDINDINNLEVDMNLCCEAVVAMIVWQMDLQLLMQSVPITTDVVGSTPAQGEVHNII